MKSIRFFLLLAGVIFSYFSLTSCQKEVSGTDPNPDPGTDNSVKLSTQGADVVSASIGVWHSQRITGAVPVSNKSTDLKISGPEGGGVPAIAGHYGFMQPTVESGDVAGYYVQVEGAGDYFKVDYTKPRRGASVSGRASLISTLSLGSARRNTETNRTGSPISVTGGDDNYNDSAIVVTLPPNIKAPDTICVKFWAYDETGLVSNPVSTCIYISHLGGDESSKWLDGTWRISSSQLFVDDKLYKEMNRSYNKWIEDKFKQREMYFNRDDSLLQVSYFTDNYEFNSYRYSYLGETGWSDQKFVQKSSDILLGVDSSYWKEHQIYFKPSGDYDGLVEFKLKIVDFANSSTQRLIFSESLKKESYKGAWSYNRGAQMLLIIEEYFNEDGSSAGLEASSAKINKLSDTKFQIINEYVIDGEKLRFVNVWEKKQ